MVDHVETRADHVSTCKDMPDKKGNVGRGMGKQWGLAICFRENGLQLVLECASTIWGLRLLLEGTSVVQQFTNSSQLPQTNAKLESRLPF